MYSRELIEEIRQRVNLVRVVGELVPLKKNGRNYVGRCPFHQEKTPSFSVSEDKQLYYCFGCGAGGSVFQFLMTLKNLTFREAIEQLAPLAGVDLVESSETLQRVQNHDKRDQAFQLLDKIKEIYAYLLGHPQSGKTARDYLVSRGFDEAFIKTHQFGFAPDSHDYIAKCLGKFNLSEDLAVELGVVGKKGNQVYDNFRNRIMIPICDYKGKTIGFGGRAMGSLMPKYLNSSQSFVFDKSRTLYGLDKAKEHVRHSNALIVVEGYMDQLALVQFGFPQTVATLGTALTEQHAELLKRYTDRVVLLFDGDQAGSRAATRSMKPLLMQGLDVRVVFLPDELDPDDFVRKHGNMALQSLLDTAPALLHHYIEHAYLKEHDLSQKSAALESLVHLVQSTKQLFVRQALMTEICQKAKLPLKLFDDGSSKVAMSVNVGDPKKLHAQPSLTATRSKEYFMLLRMALEVPGINVAWTTALEATHLFSLQDISEGRLWLDLVEDMKGQDGTLSEMVDLWPKAHERGLLTKVFIEDVPLLEQQASKMWTDCLNHIRNQKIKQTARDIAQAEKDLDDARVSQLFVQLQDLKKSLN